MVLFLVVCLGDLEGEGRGEGAVGKATEDFGELRPGLGSGQLLGPEAGFDAGGQGLRKERGVGKRFLKFGEGGRSLGVVAGPEEGVGPPESGFGLKRAGAG